MEEMVLGTSKYVSTRRAAKITGYAQDYVGQLVRTGKVKATKVGKSWFVLEDDVLKLSGKAAALQSPERALAVLEKRSLTMTKSVVSVSVEYPKTWSNVQYFTENEPLLPISDKRDVNENKPSIELLDDHTVRISGGSVRRSVTQTKPAAAKVGSASDASRGMLQMSSFDGVRYAASSVALGTQASTDIEADESADLAHPVALLARESSDFGFGWFFRLVVSAGIVSLFGLLIPIF